MSEQEISTDQIRAELAKPYLNEHTFEMLLWKLRKIVSGQ